jgi:hypothetical protein
MQQIKYFTALYALHKPDVNKVEAVTLNVHKPIKKFNVYVVIKEYLNVLTMVMNYKHFHAKRCTTLNTVNKWYPNICGCRTKVQAHNRPRSTVKCEWPIRICAVKKIEIRPEY